MSESAKDDGEVPQKGWIESLLESLEMVQWDRFVRAEDDKLGVYFDIYGWIDRDEDAYKDFILLRVFPETDENLRMFTTSSDHYHDEINEILFGDTSESNHCQRVEHTFEVPNVVEIDEPELATDGGRVEDADGVSHPAARNADQLAWAVWVGDRRTGECVSVVADSEQAAKNKALAESDEDEVRNIDGPFQDGEPAHYEFTFYTEHRETLVVEAPAEDYAKETAEAERTHRGEYIQTTHTEVRRVPKDAE